MRIPPGRKLSTVGWIPKLPVLGSILGRSTLFLNLILTIIYSDQHSVENDVDRLIWKFFIWKFWWSSCLFRQKKTSKPRWKRTPRGWKLPTLGWISKLPVLGFDSPKRHTFFFWVGYIFFQVDTAGKILSIGAVLQFSVVRFVIVCDLIYLLKKALEMRITRPLFWD